ncbi:MAG: ATP synthase F0 subunit B [Myxococcales bacterium]|nr:ATP synthase F0 subunit B [Myxococcales bacterium]
MTLDLDITYIVVLALFLLPLLIVNGIVLRPFMALFEARYEKLEGALERAEEMLEDAERRARVFEERIRGAAKQGMEKRSSIRAEAMNTMNGRLDEARHRLQTKLDAALQSIADEQQRGLNELNASADHMADKAASKLLGRAA